MLDSTGMPVNGIAVGPDTSVLKAALVMLIGTPKLMSWNGVVGLVPHNGLPGVR